MNQLLEYDSTNSTTLVANTPKRISTAVLAVKTPVLIEGFTQATATLTNLPFAQFRRASKLTRSGSFTPFYWHSLYNSYLINPPSGSRETLGHVIFSPPNMDEKRILRLYQVEDTQVKDFLSEHKKLIPALVDARDALYREIGNEAVKLVLRSDPYSGERTLWGLIRFRSGELTARERLHRFNTNWFASNLKRFDEQVNFNIAYI